MGWNTLALVTPGEIGALEPEATAAGKPWGSDSWGGAISEAKRDLRIWLESDFADVPGVADRVVETWDPDWIYATTGGTDTDYTDRGGDDEPSDVALASIFATAANDTLEIASASEFRGLHVYMGATLNAAASVISAWYRGAAGWTSISPLTDGTLATSTKSFSQSGRITWSLPSDWERVRLHSTGDEYYWIRLKVSATLTASTSATQILTVRPPDGLKRVASYLALYHVYNGSAAQSADPAQWRDRAAYYWERATGTYAMLRDKGGIPIDRNADQVVTPAEVRQYAPLVMRRG